MARAQIQGDNDKWKVFNYCLWYAIQYCMRGQVFPKGLTLYCGLHNVKMSSDLNKVHFATYVSTSSALSVAKMFRQDAGTGMILEFDASIVNDSRVSKAYVGWISGYQDEKEVLFARSYCGDTSVLTSSVGSSDSLLSDVPWKAQIIASRSDACTQWVRITSH